MTHALNIPYWIKTKLGYKPQDFVKPFDCAFCWSFWMVAPFLIFNWKLILTNTIISYIYGKVHID